MLQKILHSATRLLVAA